MADFERDIKLLEEYKQWQAINKHKPDTSPTAYMVEKAQQEAFEKLEELASWRKKLAQDISPHAKHEFDKIMEGTS